MNAATINIFGWVCLVSVLLIVGILLGISFRDDDGRRREELLGVREAKLKAEWQSLQTAQQLYAAYLESRRAMQEEAIRQPRPRIDRP